jgi:hypothetical protein
MLNKSTTGKWLISVHKHLQEFSESAELTYFDSTIRAAQCGRLLALIRKKEIISGERELVEMARTIKIPPTILNRIILPELESRNSIIVERSRDGEIKQVREFAPTEHEILEETSEIWESLTPRDEERATVLALEICSLLPRSKSELQARLENQGLPHASISVSFDLQKAFGLLKAGDFNGEREPVFYNEYIFQKNIEQVVRYLRRLEENEREQLENLIGQIRLNQGFPIRDIKGIPNPMLQAARTTGLLDVTRIRTIDGKEQAFAFTPHFCTFGARSVGPFDDIWNEVQLFVAHVTYGARFARTSTGRIRNPIVLVEALLRDREIGPATAIGRDYPLLETHGIVQTRESKFHSGRYHMQLVKDDVVQRALKVLKYGSESGIAEGFAQSGSGLYVPGRFLSPEQDRLLLESRLGRQAAAIASVEQKILQAWRSEEF